MTAVLSTSATIEHKAREAGGAAGVFAGGLLGIEGVPAADLAGVLELAGEVKADPGAFAGALSGVSVTMLFEKPSLRTRMSFEIGLTRLGAHVVYFDHSQQRIGQRECVKDYAKNLERWTDCVIARVFSHDVLAEFAAHASIPVVNALSDLEHPCQTLADLLTLKEHYGALEGLQVAWVGDGNNVCHSLMLACAALGVSFTAVTPRGFEPKFAVLKAATAAAEKTGATISVGHALRSVKGHHAVYTDTWVSMGQEHQDDLRGGAFEGMQVDEDVMALASEGLDAPAAFMHCLPAHRGEEVVDGVIDAPESLVYEQAENRMWAQNALMLKVFGKA